MAALGNILAGARITASLVQGVAPLAVIKGADQSVTSSVTLINDNALFVPVAANASYLVECMLDYEGGTRGSSDLKFTWAVPSGAVMRYSRLHQDTSGAPTVGFLSGAGGAGVAAGTNLAGNLFSVVVLGSLVMGATAGSLQLQWAQNTSSATATIVHAGSVLALWQIA